MQRIEARKLWENGSFVGECATLFPITCDQISTNSPRYGYLIPVGGCCGLTGQYQLSMGNPNPAATEDASLALNAAAGVLRGVWVEGGGGIGALYDALTTDEIFDACNACCDEATAEVYTVAPRYDGVFPEVADITPTVFTFTRADNGDVLAFQRFLLDYLGQYVEGTVKRTAYAGGNSTYTFEAKQDPSKIGADTYVETARVFDSNSVAAGGAGFHYTANAVINGVTMPTLDDDAYNATSDLVTAATGNATWAAQGTWTAPSATVLRLTSTTANTATITLTNVAD